MYLRSSKKKMASAAVYDHCKECENGVTTCNGCREHFCVEHFVNHRQELDARMDEVGQKYNVLKQDLEQDAMIHPFLSRIERWREESMKKVNDTARKAQADLQNYIFRRTDQLKQLLNQMNGELKTTYGSQNYTEEQLNTWMQRLEELRNMLEKPSNIEIVEEDMQPFTGKINFVESYVAENRPVVDIVTTQPTTSSPGTPSSE